MSDTRKWALVLGSSSGFGEAASLRLARDGFDIFGVHLDRKGTQPNAERIAGEIRAMGRLAVFFNANAADDEKRKEIVAAMAVEIAKEGGGVAALMHSLAFASLGPIVGNGALTRDRIEMTLDVMANSLVYWTQDLIAQKLFAPEARVLAMTSEGSRRCWPGYGAVSAAKCVLESYVRQLAVELAPLGIVTAAIRAGVTDTPALRRIPAWEDMLRRVTERSPFQRATTPPDVAGVISLLCRAETRWITGSIVDVDGGENIV